MQPRPGITPALARFVVDTRWEDIPERARHEAKRALLNFFAVALAASSIIGASGTTPRPG